MLNSVMVESRNVIQDNYEIEMYQLKCRTYHFLVLVHLLLNTLRCLILQMNQPVQILLYYQLRTKNQLVLVNLRKPNPVPIPISSSATNEQPNIDICRYTRIHNQVDRYEPN